MQIMTVTAFVQYLNETFRAIWDANEVAVEGEVTGYRVSQGQWVNFELKDEGALVSIFMPVAKLHVPLQDGMRVRIFGWPRIYPKYGKFSLSAERVELVGEGALQKALMMLRERLTKEGLFDPSRKRTLPRFPQRIALIASRESAAYGDFIRILNERWSGLEIDLYHVLVQGEGAPVQIVKAIKEANKVGWRNVSCSDATSRVLSPKPPYKYSAAASVACREPVSAPPALEILEDSLSVRNNKREEEKGYDAIVLTRGGGSLEELMAFNDESVVRALFSSKIPTLVGIGHERDLTMAEEVADVRGSTPTDCARRLVPDKEEILYEMAQMQEGISSVLDGWIQEGVRIMDRAMMLADHWMQTVVTMQRSLVERLDFVADRWLQTVREELTAFDRLLSSLHPQHVLARGYALVLDAKGRVKTSIKAFQKEERVRIRLRDGVMGAVITEEESHPST